MIENVCPPTYRKLDLPEKKVIELSINVNHISILSSVNQLNKHSIFLQSWLERLMSTNNICKKFTHRVNFTWLSSVMYYNNSYIKKCKLSRLLEVDR